MLRDDQNNACFEDYVTSSFRTIASVEREKGKRHAAGVSRQIPGSFCSETAHLGLRATFVFKTL